MLTADIHRQFGGTSVSKFARLYAPDPGFRPLVPLRLYQRTHGTQVGKALFPALWLWHRRSTKSARIDMSIRTPGGDGLMIAHSVGIVLNERARIGCNVTIFHRVTLGQADRVGANGSLQAGSSPIFEDDVWIGPHATIVGGVRIGRGSRILANAMVTADVPPYSMVAGNPARIVRSDCAPDVPNPAPVSPTLLAVAA